MPNVPESGPKTQSVRPAVPPTTQAPFTYKYLSESALLRAMCAHDFAKKICKVRNFAYLCSARTMLLHHKSTYSNAIKRCPLSTSAHAVVSFWRTNRGNASFYIPIN